MIVQTESTTSRRREEEFSKIIKELSNEHKNSSRQDSSLKYVKNFFSERK